MASYASLQLPVVYPLTPLLKSVPRRPHVDARAAMRFSVASSDPKPKRTSHVPARSPRGAAGCRIAITPHRAHPPSLPLLVPPPIRSASVGLAGGVIAIVSGIYFLYSVLAEEQGNSEMRRLRGLIYDGAREYLFTQYRWLCGWAAIMFIII